MASNEPGSHEKHRKRRRISVYDAVAGRVGYEGFLTEPKPSKYRDTASTSSTAVAPEEVLFRRKGAPPRYEEDDIYVADRHLKPSQRLPDSDLLKAIHAYASDYYAATEDEGGGRGDFWSMDETALLAMGILLEEAAAEAIGETGHLALVEIEHKSQPGVTSDRDGSNTVKALLIDSISSSEWHFEVISPCVATLVCELVLSAVEEAAQFADVYFHRLKMHPNGISFGRTVIHTGPALD